MHVLKNTKKLFILKREGTLKIYRHVFDKKKKKKKKKRKEKKRKGKNGALNFLKWLRLGVIGTKNLCAQRYSEYRKSFSQNSVSRPHDLQLQLFFSNSTLRDVNYCAFRSQNNSDSLLACGLITFAGSRVETSLIRAEMLQSTAVFNNSTFLHEA